MPRSAIRLLFSYLVHDVILQFAVVGNTNALKHTSEIRLQPKSIKQSVRISQCEKNK